MLKRFLRCRRGAVGLMATMSLPVFVAMIGFGTEVGMWYADQRHAQSAADAAAYSGAFWIAQNATNPDTQTLDYRAREFAAQNGFCSTGDANALSYPSSNCGSVPPSITQTVTITRGNYSGGAFTASATGNAVQAIASQVQATLFSRIWLTSSTVTIGATAIAQVQNPKGVCAIGLQNVKLNGSYTMAGGNCTIASDNTFQIAGGGNNDTWTGSGWLLTAVNGCSPGASTCDGFSIPYDWNSEPVYDPLTRLNTTTFPGVTTSSTPNVNCNSPTCTLTPSLVAYGNMHINSGGTMTLAPGTYFFYNSTIQIDGGGTLTATGPVNIVMLGSSSKLTVNGGGTVNLYACFTSQGCTPTFSSLDGVLFYDQGTQAFTVNGSSTSRYGGSIYAPNAAVTWGGNQQSSLTTCTEVIGNTLTIGGNSYLATAGCAAGTVPETQAIVMVL